MWPVAIAVGCVLLVVSGFVWVARRDELARVRAIAALTLRPLSSVEPGELVAVELSTDEVGVDPVQNEPSSWWRATVSRDAEPTYEGAALASADELTCEGGRAVVELDEASVRFFGEGQLGLVPQTREPTDEADATMRDIVDRSPHAETFAWTPAPFALTWASLPVGARLTVVGRATVEDGERVTTDDGYRGQATGVLRFRRQDVRLVSRAALDVAQRRETESVRAMRTMLVVAALLGLASVALGAWLSAG